MKTDDTTTATTPKVITASVELSVADWVNISAIIRCVDPVGVFMQNVQTTIKTAVESAVKEQQK